MTPAALDNLVFIGAFALTGSIGRSQIAGARGCDGFQLPRRAPGGVPLEAETRRRAPEICRGGDRQRARVLCADSTAALRFRNPHGGRETCRGRPPVPHEFRDSAGLVFTKRANPRPRRIGTNTTPVCRRRPNSRAATRHPSCSISCADHAAANNGEPLSIVEIGGANSCFMKPKIVYVWPATAHRTI